MARIKGAAVAGSTWCASNLDSKICTPERKMRFRDMLVNMIMQAYHKNPGAEGVFVKIKNGKPNNVLSDALRLAQIPANAFGNASFSMCVEDNKTTIIYPDSKEEHCVYSSTKSESK